MNAPGIDLTIGLFERACLESGLRPAGPWKAKTKWLLSTYVVTAESMIGAVRIEGMAEQTENWLRMQYQEVSSINTQADNWRNATVSMLSRNLKEFIQHLLTFKDAAAYERQLTNNVHALYSRAMSRRGFISDTGAIIERQLTEAWKTGADEMMVLPEDMLPEDDAYLKKIIDGEKSYLDGLADAVQDAAGNREGWEKFNARIRMWVNRILDVENQARMYFGQLQKLVWHLGPTEEHCHTGDRPGGIGCSELNGIVAFARDWLAVGIKPQGNMLSCGGHQCLCTCTPTSERRTRGGLQRLRALAGR